MRALPPALVAGLFVTGCATNSAPPIVTSPPANDSDVLQLQHGRSLFVSRCIECHTLPDPHRYPREAWPLLVDKMSKRADLKPAERDAIVAYVEAASRRK